MSFESNEARLEILETKTAMLLEIQNRMMEMHRKTTQMDSLVLKLIVSSKEELTAVLRFIATNPIFGDAKIRQPFLDMVARAESQIDFINAQIEANQMPPTDQLPGA